MSKVLVVDDEVSVQNLILEMMTYEGYDVLKVGNVVDAIEVCKQENVILVITEIIMPDRNGLDLILEIKKEYPHISIIAMSGCGNETRQYDCLEVAKLVGVNNIIKKPFDMPELLQLVVQSLKAQGCTHI